MQFIFELLLLTSVVGTFLSAFKLVINTIKTKQQQRCWDLVYQELDWTFVKWYECVQELKSIDPNWDNKDIIIYILAFAFEISDIPHLVRKYHNIIYTNSRRIKILTESVTGDKLFNGPLFATIVSSSNNYCKLQLNGIISGINFNNTLLLTTDQIKTRLYNAGSKLECTECTAYKQILKLEQIVKNNTL